MNNVSAATAIKVLDLYAEVYRRAHGEGIATGLAAMRRACGPALALPEGTAAETEDAIGHDTVGNGRPAVVMEGGPAYCHRPCCETSPLGICWTAAVQEEADNQGLGVYLEAANHWAVSIYPA